MKLQKGILIVFFSLLLLSVSSISVFAETSNNYYNTVNDFLTSVFSAAKPVFEALVGDSNDADAFLGKILILILIFSIILIVLGEVELFKNNKFFSFIVSLIVGLLGVRFLTPDFVQSIILSQKVLVVSIAAGFPFFLYFLAIRRFAPNTRRIAWILFAVAFTMLWISTYEKLSSYGNGVEWIYPVTAVLAVVMIWFDGTLARFWKIGSVQRKFTPSQNRLYNKYTRDLDELYEVKGNPTLLASYKVQYDPDPAKASTAQGIASWKVDEAYLIAELAALAP